MGRGLCSRKTINYVFSWCWHFLFALPCRNKTLHIHLRNFAWLITVDYPLIESGLDQLCLTNKDTRLESALPSETTAETAITWEPSPAISDDVYQVKIKSEDIWSCVVYFGRGGGSEHYTEESVILTHKIANIQQNSVPLMASFLHPLAQRERCNHCNFRVCGEKEEEGGLGLQYLETRRRHQLILSAAGLTGLNRWWQLFRELWKQPAFSNGWRILSKKGFSPNV